MVEEQLKSQSEMKSALERVQQRTVDVGELVQSSLRKREEELARREDEMARFEADFNEEEAIQFQLLEKQLSDEERRLQARKDALLKLKQSQNEDVNRVRDQRHNLVQNYASDEQTSKQ